MTGIVAQVGPAARYTLRVLGVLADLCMVILGVLVLITVPVSVEQSTDLYVAVTWACMLIVGPVLAMFGTWAHRARVVAPGLCLEAGGIVVWGIAIVTETTPPSSTIAVAAAFGGFIFTIAWRGVAAVVTTPAPREGKAQ